MPSSSKTTNQSGFAHILLIILLIAAIAIGIYLVSQRTILRSRAGGETPETSLTLVGRSDNNDNIISPSLSGPILFGNEDQSLNVSSDGTFYVDVLVKSNIDAVNLIAAKIKYPTDLLQVTGIKTSPSGVLGAMIAQASTCEAPAITKPVNNSTMTPGPVNIYWTANSPGGYKVQVMPNGQPCDNAVWGQSNCQDSTTFTNVTTPGPGYYASFNMPSNPPAAWNYYKILITNQCGAFPTAQSIVYLSTGTGPTPVPTAVPTATPKPTPPPTPKCISISCPAPADNCKYEGALTSTCDSNQYNNLTCGKLICATPLPTPTASATAQPVIIPFYFIPNWIEQTFNNSTGLIRLAGGIPTPGFQNPVGQYGLMARIKFQALPGSTGKTAKIEFQEDGTEMYKNSDNTLLTPIIKRSLNVSIGTVSLSGPINIPTSGQTTTATTTSSSTTSTTVTPLISTDLNKNGHADLGDISVFLSDFKQGTYNPDIDFDNNQKVNSIDFSLIASYLRSQNVIN